MFSDLDRCRFHSRKKGPCRQASEQMHMDGLWEQTMCKYNNRDRRLVAEVRKAVRAVEAAAQKKIPCTDMLHTRRSLIGWSLMTWEWCKMRRLRYRQLQPPKVLFRRWTSFGWHGNNTQCLGTSVGIDDGQTTEAERMVHCAGAFFPGVTRGGGCACSYRWEEGKKQKQTLMLRLNLPRPQSREQCGDAEDPENAPKYIDCPH